MNQRKIAWMVAAGVALFLGGFVPGYVKGRSLNHALARAVEREQIYRARDTLGTTFLQITLKNYGVAQENASKFFNQARNLASETDSAELRTTLEGLLARRDDLSGKLGRAAPEVYSDVQEMYRMLISQTKPMLDGPP